MVVLTSDDDSIFSVQTSHASLKTGKTSLRISIGRLNDVLPFLALS
jgi:hypothetical protein